MTDARQTSVAEVHIMAAARQIADLQDEVERLRRLVLRDHAQGHKAHADCPACQKFGVHPNA